MMQLDIFGLTDNGKVRLNNEDASTIIAQGWSRNNRKIALPNKGVLLAVADGLGGAKAGEIASGIAISIVSTAFNQITTVPETDEERTKIMEEAIINAHHEIVQASKDLSEFDFDTMGTTITVVWIYANTAYISWCGDSRCYIYRKNTPFKPITNDHSLVWEGVKKGLLTPEQARLHPESNIVLQSLGSYQRPPVPESIVYDLGKGDRIMVCTDGLNSMLSDESIEKILANLKGDAQQISQQLIAESIFAGGLDNVTVIVCDVLVSKANAANNKKRASNNALPTSKPLLPKLLKAAAVVGVLGFGTYYFAPMVMGKGNAASVSSVREISYSSESQPVEVAYKENAPQEKIVNTEAANQIKVLLEKQQSLWKRIENIISNNEKASSKNKLNSETIVKIKEIYNQVSADMTDLFKENGVVVDSNTGLITSFAGDNSTIPSLKFTKAETFISIADSRITDMLSQERTHNNEKPNSSSSSSSSSSSKSNSSNTKAKSKENVTKSLLSQVKKEVESPLDSLVN